MVDSEDSVSGEAELLAVDSSVSSPVRFEVLPLDSHPLIGQVRVDVPQHLRTDPEHRLMSAIGLVTGSTTSRSGYSKLPYLGSDQESMEEPEYEDLCMPCDFVDRPPKAMFEKSIPDITPSMFSLPNTASNLLCSDACCPECFNLSDECSLCEDNDVASLLASMSGASIDGAPQPMTGWSTYVPEGSAMDSSRHTETELTAAIRRLESNQLEGAAMRLKDYFRGLREKRSTGDRISFCVDSGATHNICSDHLVFETLDYNAPVKRFRVVHGSATICSQGMGTVLLPVVTTAGEKISIRIHNVYYVPSQPFNLLSVSSLIVDGWSDPTFSKLYWNFGKFQVPLVHRGNYFVESPSVSDVLSVEGSDPPPTRTEQKNRRDTARAQESVHKRDRADWQ